jgi:TatD DNase family protein
MKLPLESEYIDIHTHSGRDNCYCIQNIFAQDLPAGLPKGGPFCAGLHPWHLEEIDNSACLAYLEEYATNPDIIAIGEAGLDRNKNIPFDLQEKIFTEQIGISERVQKPLVIHCVKAYSDLLHIRKNKEWQMKWMFHWFNENLEIANELILMDCHLSFGRSLLHPNGKNAEVFRQLPLERIFLETDDAEITIENIYAKAAELKEISIDEMKKQIYFNFRSVFLK